ncbi:unnamed protein product, partial [marine sediment metagenome]
HCHCLPGFDDGPEDLKQAVKLCKSLVEDGIETVVAAPHVLGGFDGNCDAEDIRRAVAELNQALDKQQIPLKVLPGAEVRLDERIESLLDNGVILTVADGSFLLLELLDQVLIDISSLLISLRQKNIQCIIVHPERCSYLAKAPGIIKKWLSLGAVLQVTAASLLGRGYLGYYIKDFAWSLVESGQVSIIATDAHDTGERKAMMTAAYNAISTRLSPEIAEMLCIKNPRRVIEAKKPLTIT